jgi:hypothetical protein
MFGGAQNDLPPPGPHEIGQHGDSYGRDEIEIIGFSKGGTDFLKFDIEDHYYQEKEGKRKTEQLPSYGLKQRFTSLA